jgi:ABC-type antimicrobial peptide transport system permease subunit
VLKNIFKIIFRDLLRDKVYTSIGIFGLAAGISVAVIIITICYTFISFNRFHVNGKNIYQAYHKSFESGGSYMSETNSYVLGESLKRDYPEIKDAVSIISDNAVMFIAGKVKAEQKGCYSEPSLFRIFTFPVIASLKNGEEKIFSDNNSVAISESVAKKFFGGVSNSLGKHISINRRVLKEDVYVSSVYKDMPENSSIKYDFVLPVKSKLTNWPWLNNWGELCAGTYFEIRENADISELNKKIKNYLTDINIERGWHQRSDLFLYRYEDTFMNPPGYPQKTIFLSLFLVIAFSILVIAAINFINLATSRAVKKGKEIGLRKAAGAGRGTLIARFMCETYLLSLFAIFLGLLFAELFIPRINTLVNPFLVFKIPYDNFYFILLLLGLWIITGMLAGLYPAIYLSGLSPKNIFGNNSVTGGRILFRKALVSAQFIFSALFIFISIVMYNQMAYISNKDLGLNIKQVLEFPLTSNIVKHFSAFSEDLKKIPGIQQVTAAEYEPVNITSTSSELVWDGKPADYTEHYRVLSVWDNFNNAFDVKILKGRDFTNSESKDNSGFIINEKMEKLIQSTRPGDVVGTGMSCNGIHGEIIGVIRDFHTLSLQNSMQPLIIRENANDINYGFVKVSSASLQKILSSIQKVYGKYEDEYPLQVKYLDEQYRLRHIDAAVFESMFGLFAIIAIVISCLGLFGLTAFSIQQKTKEIGIRKVLGASVRSVLMLLIRSMISTIIISTLIAMPVGYYLADKLLQLFVYRTTINYTVFVLTIVITLLLAAVTVIFQVIKAALANPVDSIKYE